MLRVQSLFEATNDISNAIEELKKAKLKLLNCRSSHHSSIAIDIATLEELMLSVEEEAYEENKQ